MKRLPLLIALLCHTGISQAIVSLEDLHTAELVEGFSGMALASVSGASGNTENSSASLGGRLQWHQAPRTDYLLLNYSYGESRDIRDTNKAFAHLRHIQDFRPRLAWEGFLQFQTNEFARLSLRSLLGGGLRHNLIGSGGEGATASYLGLGAFYEQERLDVLSGSGEQTTHHALRGNAYLILQLPLTPQTRLFSTTYYQPDLDQFSDYRLTEQAGIKVKMAENLDLRLSLEYSYDSQPPVAVRKHDFHYLSGIEYRF